jgi:Uma2 family endonuclease
MRCQCRPRGGKHESYKISLNHFWVRRISGAYFIAQETTFRLNESSFLESDFVFYDSRVKVPQLAPANTLLAVEISDSSLTYDMGRKAKLYARHGIPALWVIDVNALVIHVFGQPAADGYASTRIVKPDEILAPSFAPELALKLAELTLI